MRMTAAAVFIMLMRWPNSVNLQLWLRTQLLVQ
jgi:hypothetical protein